MKRIDKSVLVAVAQSAESIVYAGEHDVDITGRLLKGSIYRNYFLPGKFECKKVRVYIVLEGDNAPGVLNDEERAMAVKPGQYVNAVKEHRARTGADLTTSANAVKAYLAEQAVARGTLHPALVRICPTCNAPVGTPCRTRDGVLSQPHVDRRFPREQEGKEPEPLTRAERAQKIPCPTCQAPAGEPCITSGWRTPTRPHVARLHPRAQLPSRKSTRGRHWDEKPCPTCGAPKGRKCRAKSGRTTDPHKARLH